MRTIFCLQPRQCIKMAAVWKSTLKQYLRLAAFASIGVGGWIAGSALERRKLFEQQLQSVHEINGYQRLSTMPGLPIFGTVSAASPIDNKLTKFSEIPSELPKVTRVSQIMKYGFPGMDNIRSFDDYVLSYDRRNRVAHWVFEHLTRENTKHNDTVDRSKCEFTEDTSIHQYFRSQNKDYKGSGYDRGHLAAAGNHRCHQKHVEQTFLLSNMAPQVGVGFNRHSWNRLEKHIRKLTHAYKNVYVCTGPLYLPKKEGDGKLYVRYEVIGANNVAVPTHFFKVIVAEAADQMLEMEAYVMPNSAINDDTPLNTFMVPPESVERSAGLLFFDRISRDKLKKINGKKSTWV